MLRLLTSRSTSISSPLTHRLSTKASLFITRKMSEVLNLTAPNGKKFTLNTGLFIDNKFVKAKSGDTITSVDPTTEKDICTIEAAGPEDVDIAVIAARKALHNPAWRDMDPTERGKLLIKVSDILQEEKETFATIDTWDNGKPYSIAFGDDMTEVINVFRYYGGFADKLFGQTIPVASTKFAYTLKQPVGVCGQIIPWNFPMSMLAWKLGPALACGNAVVLKPAEQTPLSALYFAGIIEKAGFPPGVVNILNGYGKTAGHAIASHLDIDKIAFTGSTVTGKQIQKTASINMKNITLETGGKSPIVIFDDCDLEQAAKWAHIGIMYNQGQVCCATSRLFVQEGVYSKFIEKFKEVVKTLSKVGDPFDEATFQGPQVTKTQYERVLGFIEQGKTEGAKLEMGGTKNTSVGSGKGFFIDPTIFTDVTPSMKIYQEEVFGPFASVISFKTEEEALAKANDTVYGLGAAVFTKDLQRAHRVANRLEAGMVWINSSNDTDFRVPFGGVKQSGIGRELGEAALASYSQTKAVHVNLGTTL